MALCHVVPSEKGGGGNLKGRGGVGGRTQETLVHCSFPAMQS